MPSCFEVVGGYLQQTATTLEECAGFVVIDAQTYRTEPTLADIFNIPLTSDLQTIFWMSCTLPMLFYVTAWAFQSVIGFIDRHDAH